MHRTLRREKTSNQFFTPLFKEEGKNARGKAELERLFTPFAKGGKQARLLRVAGGFLGVRRFIGDSDALKSPRHAQKARMATPFCKG